MPKKHCEYLEQVNLPNSFPSKSKAHFSLQNHESQIQLKRMEIKVSGKSQVPQKIFDVKMTSLVTNNNKQTGNNPCIQTGVRTDLKGENFKAPESKGIFLQNKKLGKGRLAIVIIPYKFMTAKTCRINAIVKNN